MLSIAFHCFPLLSIAFPVAQAMGDMTAVMGNRQAALDVAKQAMQRVAESPYVSAVPGGYPETQRQGEDAEDGGEGYAEMEVS